MTGDGKEGGWVGGRDYEEAEAKLTAALTKSESISGEKHNTFTTLQFEC